MSDIADINIDVDAHLCTYKSSLLLTVGKECRHKFSPRVSVPHSFYADTDSVPNLNAEPNTDPGENVMQIHTLSVPRLPLNKFLWHPKGRVS
jgi:hypothetical protein